MINNIELQRLIGQMGSRTNAEALEAVEELRKRRWLEFDVMSSANLNDANLGGADLHEADLSGVSLARANLSGANLSRARLTGAALYDANLRGVDLSGADLNRAHLSGASLTGANLAGTNLRGVDLSGADLSKANLNGANLGEARLIGTNLRQANLSGSDLIGASLSLVSLSDSTFANAICGNTVFVGVDLSTVNELDKVEHYGPSFIDVQTLYNSKGQIPDIFLRGCGVPENLVTYHRSLVGQAIDYYPAFISYSHEDLACAQRIHDTLQGQGIRCWLDVHQIKPGHHIWDEIERGIRLWDKTILCCSEYSLTSDWVENELENLFAKERRVREQLKKQQGSDPGPVRLLIPLDLDGYVFSEKFKSGMKQHIVSRNVADFTNWKNNSDKFDREMEEVVAFLRPDEGREPPPPSLLSR